MLRQRGFSLIEIMVSLSLGLLVTGSAFGLLITALATGRESIDQARLNQEVRHLANSMRRDFLRAGYWQAMEAVVQISARCDLQVADAGGGSVTVRSVVSGSNAACSAFVAPLSSAVLLGRSLVSNQLDTQGVPSMRSLRIDAVIDANRLMVSQSGSSIAPLIPAGSWTIDNPFSTLVQTGDCLVFGYDEDGDGQRGDQEWFGYRMDTNTRAVRGVNNARSCGSGDWENISDERTVYVSALSFSLPFSMLQTSSGAELRRHMATLRLDARLRRDERINRKIETRVRVRNDAQAW